MVDPVRVQQVSIVGRLKAPDPLLERVFFSFNADFSVAANIIFDMNAINQKDIFGGPIRSMFMDNSSNPNETTVYVQGTDQFFTVPAYAQGVFPVDANMNSIMEFETLGGADDTVTITVYNYERSPSVWYRYGAISKDVPLKMQGAWPDGTDMDPPTEFINPVYVGGGVDGTHVLRALNVDATGRLRIVGAAAGGNVFGTDDNGDPPTAAPVLVAGWDGVDVRTLLTDATGQLVVAIDAPSFAGLATEAKQDDIIDIIERPAASSITSVPDAAADTLILAANAARKGATVFNDSTEILYLVVDNSVASNVNFTVKLQADGYYEVPFGYTGEIRGIWAANAAGAARVTEIV